MKFDEKREKLGKLSEPELRTNLMLPLLSGMGFSHFYDHHSSTERGKDIIFREIDKTGDAIVYAAVTTVRDIDGSVDSSQFAGRTLDQIRMALTEPFHDTYTGREETVQRCWVVTTRSIKPSARDSINGALTQLSLDRITKFIDCNRLIQLINQYYPVYWDPAAEWAYFPRLKIVNMANLKLPSSYDKEVDDLSYFGSLTSGIYHFRKAIQGLVDDVSDVHERLTEILACEDLWKMIGMWEQFEVDFVHAGGLRGEMNTKDLQNTWEDFASDLHEFEQRFGITPEERLQSSSAGDEPPCME